MNEIMLKKVTVSDSWAALADEKTPATFTVSAPPDNTGNVLVRTTDNQDEEVPWAPGEWHTFRWVNLATLQVKNEDSGATNTITVVGGTW